MNNITIPLAMALDCAEHGIAVFPGNADIKKPYIRDWVQQASTDKAQILKWWETFPNAMIAIATGKKSGLFVLDVDKHHDEANGYLTLSDLEAEYGELPDTYQVETPSGGRHYYFRYPEGRTVMSSTSKIGKGLDIRSDGACVYAPPSLRADGTAYKIINDIALAEAPEWLLELVEKKEISIGSPSTFTASNGEMRVADDPEAYMKKILQEAIQTVSDATEGKRNNTLYKVGADLYGFVVGGALNEFEFDSALVGACHTNGLMADESEVKNTIDSAKKKGVLTPKTIIKREIEVMEDEKVENTKQDGITYPSNYILNETGLWKTEKVKGGEVKTIRIGDPIAFIGVGRNESECEGWGSLLEWKAYDGTVQEHLVLFSDYADKKFDWAKKMSSKGYPVRPPHIQSILNFIAQTEELNHDVVLSFPRKVGWLNKSYVLPKQVFGDTKIRPQIELPGGTFYTSAGSNEEWNKVAQYSVGNIVFEFCLALAFAGPLLHFTDFVTGCTFHLVGGSTAGKSTAQRLAASVWGGKAHMGTWRTTDNALESVAYRSNDNLVVLDEFSQVDAKVIGDIVYTIANGQGKKRATRNADERPVKDWRTLALSSGEQTLADKMAGADQVKGGQKVRFIEVPVEPEMLSCLHGFSSPKESADAIFHITERNYGFAGKQFLDYVVRNYDNIASKLPSEISTLTRSLVPANSGSQVERIVGFFALVQVAGEYAKKAGILPAEMDIAGCVKKFVELWLERRGTAGNSEEMSIVQNVKQYLMTFGKINFEYGDFIPRMKNFGIRRQRNGYSEYFIEESILLKEIAKNDNRKLVVRALEQAGMLITYPSAGSRKKVHNPNNSGQWVFCVKMPDLELPDAIATAEYIPVSASKKKDFSNFNFDTPEDDDIFRQFSNAV